ncbi:MAG TPA: lysophospholipid acyltransferase family protein [Anaerolineales bacterium]|nr:lysophospholipid acyltransferase family protein [Anaerolineales bacterium]
MRYFIRFIIHFLVKLIADVEVIGRKFLPTSGTFVIATNHLGLLDIVMAFYVLNRWDLFILVGEKWGEIKWIRWISRQLNILFIDRFNPDLKAMREIIKRMKEGQVLVIAPEGTRSRTGGLIEGKAGVSFLAAKTGYPIIPVAITGTQDKVILGNIKRFKRSHITITGGPTFSLPPLPHKERDEALIKYTDEIMCRIAQLLPERYRGIYADHPRLKELQETNQFEQD